MRSTPPGRPESRYRGHCVVGLFNTRRLHFALGYPSPNEFERRAAARNRMDAHDHREQTTFDPFQIGRQGIQNHPPGRPPTLVCDREFLLQAIAHLSAGGDSSQPYADTG